MKIDRIRELLDGEIICEGDVDSDPTSVYAGDFLSRVMGKAPPNCVWLTIMNNVNVVAVAILADIKVIVLCEGVKADERFLAKCKDENIALLATELPVYDCCKRL